MEYEKGLAFTRKFTLLTIAGVTRLTAAEKSGLIIGLVSQKYWWKWPSGLRLCIEREHKRKLNIPGSPTDLGNLLKKF